MREFERPQDLLTINKWLSTYDMGDLCADDIPDVGFIVDDVACGFLCETNTSVCFIEGFITNPLALSDQRNKAIWEIADAVLQVAKSSGYKRCILLSNDKTVLNRGKILGFHDTNAKVMSMEL